MMKTLLIALLLSLTAHAQEPSEIFDVAVIGGGPSGLSCATACAKTGYKTLVLNAKRKGLFDPGLPVTNWPGHPTMTWEKTIDELRKDFIHHTGVYTETLVRSITKDRGVFRITTDTDTFRSTAVVLATGKHPPKQKFKITPEYPTRVLSRLWDESFLLPTDTVAIIGDNDAVFTSAIRAAKRSQKVYLFLQPPWNPIKSPAALLAKKISSITWVYCNSMPSINSLKDTVIVEFVSGHSKAVQRVSWAVISTDWIPDSDIAGSLVKLDSSGCIVSSDVPGLFACGEVSSRDSLLGITAAADGINASEPVHQFLLDLGIFPTPPPPAPKAPPSKAPEKPEPTTDQE